LKYLTRKYEGFLERREAFPNLNLFREKRAVNLLIQKEIIENSSRDTKNTGKNSKVDVKYTKGMEMIIQKIASRTIQRSIETSKNFRKTIICNLTIIFIEKQNCSLMLQ
jgi:hypothetical protein